MQQQQSAHDAFIFIPRASWPEGPKPMAAAGPLMTRMLGIMLGSRFKVPCDPREFRGVSCCIVDVSRLQISQDNQELASELYPLRNVSSQPPAHSSARRGAGAVLRKGSSQLDTRDYLSLFSSHLGTSEATVLHCGMASVVGQGVLPHEVVLSDVFSDIECLLIQPTATSSRTPLFSLRIHADIAPHHRYSELFLCDYSQEST